MNNIKSVLNYGWSLISDGSKEENDLCYAWIGLNVLAVGALILVKLSGAF